MNDSAESYRSHEGSPSTSQVSTFCDVLMPGTALQGQAPQVELSRVWKALTEGAVFIVDQFFRDDRCGVALLGAPAPVSAPLTGRRLDVIESVLCGVGQNCLAIDLGLAPSTVALIARQALESLGVSMRPSRVHPLLMLMATAARRGLSVSASVSYVHSERGELRVVEIARPGLRLTEGLPAAERNVIELLVEGRCYSEIAKLRRTAERTVANQIAAVFRRLHVSGRSELIQRLFVADGLIPPAPRPGTQPPPAAASLAPPPIWREPVASRSQDALRSSGIRPLSEMSQQLQQLAAGGRAR